MNLLFFLSTNVTRSSPTFHNPGHLRMWYESPLREFNPHVLLVVLLLIVIVVSSYYVYFTRKNREAIEKSETDHDESYFQQLVTKRKVLLNKIIELEESYQVGKLTKDDYQAKHNAYNSYLIQIKIELQKYLE